MVSQSFDWATARRWLVSQCGCSDAVWSSFDWDDDRVAHYQPVFVSPAGICHPKNCGVEMSDRLMHCMARLCANRRQLRCHLVCLLISFGCSGMPAAGTACHSTFDECVNACAHHCDQENRLHPHTNHLTASADNWGRGCKQCTDRCRAVAKACKKAE